MRSVEQVIRELSFYGVELFLNEQGGKRKLAYKCPKDTILTDSLREDIKHHAPNLLLALNTDKESITAQQNQLQPEHKLKHFEPRSIEALRKKNSSKPAIIQSTSYGNITATVAPTALTNVPVSVKQKKLNAISLPDADVYTIECFIPELKKSGITLNLVNDELNIYVDASMLDSSAILNTLGYIKTDISQRKDEILQYLRQNTKLNQ